MTTISPFSIGIGSVGISPLPIFVTMVFISGNFAFNIFSHWVVVFIIEVNELPVIILVSKARSPSSMVGINSPPIFWKINKATANKPIEIKRTIFLAFNALFNSGMYFCSNQDIIRSLKLVLCSVFFDKNKEVIMGT